MELSDNCQFNRYLFAYFVLETKSEVYFAHHYLEIDNV